MLGELGTKPISLDLEIKGGLQVEPEASRVAKEAAQAQRGVCSDGPLAEDDLVDPSGRNTQTLGETVLRDVERLEKFLVEDLARMNGRESFLSHVST